MDVHGFGLWAKANSAYCKRMARLRGLKSFVKFSKESFRNFLFVDDPETGARWDVGTGTLVMWGDEKPAQTPEQVRHYMQHMRDVYEHQQSN